MQPKQKVFLSLCSLSLGSYNIRLLTAKWKITRTRGDSSPLFYNCTAAWNDCSKTAVTSAMRSHTHDHKMSECFCSHWGHQHSVLLQHLMMQNVAVLHLLVVINAGLWLYVIAVWLFCVLMVIVSLYSCSLPGLVGCRLFRLSSCSFWSFCSLLMVYSVSL